MTIRGRGALIEIRKKYTTTQLFELQFRYTNATNIVHTPHSPLGTVILGLSRLVLIHNLWHRVCYL